MLATILFDRKLKRHGMVTPFGSVRRNACRKPCIQAPAPVRVGSGESCDARVGLARQRRYSLRCGLGSGDPGSARCHRESDKLRNLRLGPAPVPPLCPRDAARRHHGARNDGRGGGDRLRRVRQAEGRRPHRCTVHHHLRPMRAVQTRQLLGLRDEPIATSISPTRYSVTPLPGCSATPISPAAIRAGRRNTYAYRLPIQRTSRCRTD